MRKVGLLLNLSSEDRGLRSSLASGTDDCFHHIALSASPEIMLAETINLLVLSCVLFWVLCA